MASFDPGEVLDQVRTHKASRVHHVIKARTFPGASSKGPDRTFAIEVLRGAGILIPYPETGEVLQNKPLPKGNCAARRVLSPRRCAL
jgi:hypothetical protein